MPPLRTTFASRQACTARFHCALIVHLFYTFRAQPLDIETLLKELLHGTGNVEDESSCQPKGHEWVGSSAAPSPAARCRPCVSREHPVLLPDPARANGRTADRIVSSAGCVACLPGCLIMLSPRGGSTHVAEGSVPDSSALEIIRSQTAGDKTRTVPRAPPRARPLLQYWPAAGPGLASPRSALPQAKLSGASPSASLEAGMLSVPSGRAMLTVPVLPRS